MSISQAEWLPNAQQGSEVRNSIESCWLGFSMCSAASKALIP
jgi:hypothetical protein